MASVNQTRPWGGSSETHPFKSYKESTTTFQNVYWTPYGSYYGNYYHSHDSSNSRGGTASTVVNHHICPAVAPQNALPGEVKPTCDQEISEQVNDLENAALQ